jgi:hypothetical protein
MVAVWRVTAVCDKIRPSKLEPVLNITDVMAKMMPFICAPVLTVYTSATDQKMFFASAPFSRITLMFAACVTVINV